MRLGLEEIPPCKATKNPSPVRPRAPSVRELATPRRRRWERWRQRQKLPSPRGSVPSRCCGRLGNVWEHCCPSTWPVITVSAPVCWCAGWWSTPDGNMPEKPRRHVWGQPSSFSTTRRSTHPGVCPKSSESFLHGWETILPRLACVSYLQNTSHQLPTIVPEPPMT